MVKQRRTLLLAGTAVAVGLLYMAVGGDDDPAAAPRTGTSTRAGRSAPEALPPIGLGRVQQASVRPQVGGDGRDIFDYGAPPAPPPGSVVLPPPGPPSPLPVTVPTPPPLPPLTVKYIGSVEKKGLKVAVFMTEKKEIVSGQPGEVVMNRFRVVRIGYESVDVQQVGADQVQRLPLKGN